MRTIEHWIGAKTSSGLEVVEFACGLPHLIKGSDSDQASAGVDVFSFRQPSAWSPASPRSTSR